MEARGAFSSDAVYMERSIERAPHIETGIEMNTEILSIYLNASAQFSVAIKIIEPSPIVDSSMRDRLGEAAVAGAHGKVL